MSTQLPYIRFIVDPAKVLPGSDVPTDSNEVGEFRLSSYVSENNEYVKP